VKQCQEYFHFDIPSVIKSNQNNFISGDKAHSTQIWAKRVNKFENKPKF